MEIKIMDYNEFKKYVYWLGKFIPESMQKEAIEYLEMCDDEYIPYIIDIYNGHTWDNALKVVNKIGYPKNKEAIESILWLFQDVNWSTTELALDTVKKIYDNEPNLVIKEIEKVNQLAEKNNDELWSEGLLWLKRRLNII